MTSTMRPSSPSIGRANLTRDEDLACLCPLPKDGRSPSSGDSDRRSDLCECEYRYSSGTSPPLISYAPGGRLYVEYEAVGVVGEDAECCGGGGKYMAGFAVEGDENC